MEGRVSNDFTFHKNATTAGDGEVMSVGNGEEVLQLEITTEGTVTIKFEGMGNLETWRPLLGVKLTSPMEMLTETDDIDPFYQFDIIGISKVRMRTIANSGSATNIVGKVIR